MSKNWSLIRKAAVVGVVLAASPIEDFSTRERSGIECDMGAPHGSAEKNACDGEFVEYEGVRYLVRTIQIEGGEVKKIYIRGPALTEAGPLEFAVAYVPPWMNIKGKLQGEGVASLEGDSNVLCALNYMPYPDDEFNGDEIFSRVEADPYLSVLDLGCDDSIEVIVFSYGGDPNSRGYYRREYARQEEEKHPDKDFMRFFESIDKRAKVYRKKLRVDKISLIKGGINLGNPRAKIDKI